MSVKKEASGRRTVEVEVEVPGTPEEVWQAIATGPETAYLGFSASPSIEYWFPGRTTALYASVGGGFGTIDSTDVPGGQGQDFTLNWFAAAGVRHYLKPGFALSDRKSVV
mgnify:CR=1 FL=1